MAEDLHRLVLTLAARQQRNVTRRQLLDLGLGPAAITYQVRSRRLYRVYPGVYAVGCPPVTALERAAAAVLACGPGAVLSQGSAASLWGFQKQWQTPVHVTVPGDRRPAGIRVHRAKKLLRRDLRRHLGIPVTSPARTMLDWAPELSNAQLTRAVNDARLGGRLSIAQLTDVLERFPRHPGTKLLIPFVETQSGPTRSEFEDTFREFCRRYELPAPRVNARVAGYEVDALFEAERLIVELDGWSFHSTRASFERDRDRDADTLAAGFGTVRITWERMQRARAKEAGRLRAILAARPDATLPPP